ncbi:NAD(P)/FAD-dependent oxidoreductase [Kutzneria buriramensis]|uniref:Flavin-dependent dehydrogenase n=1 Tax=Kutzneria buriramensis TaxID=1045776 RepID=A0A3E0HF74_9PSEU|nr:FAD-dependent oxidoreductase [Kutzneria buriramensis]REH43838.1 flavin-dependent dehydrogenase [Kutzneria buriramensis]
MYDVIVVGARCAGSPTAMLFARAGYRVLLLDKARFPRDTLSTHYLHQPAVARLASWGLLDAVTASNCPPIDLARHKVADVVLEGCSLPVDGHRSAYAPRRFVLDPILAAGAVAAGVEFRENCTVEDLLFEDNRVVGVRCRTRSGTVAEERATLVVGADGMRSLVATKVAAPFTISHPLMSCTYYSYWEGVPSCFELFEGNDRWVGALPTNDGLTLISTYFPQSAFDRVRADAQTAYLANIRATTPELYERMLGGRQAERLYGTGDQQNYFRRAAGPGWALVGDAGHHKDSITARGISDAFLQAELLVSVIGSRLGDHQALERFGAERDAKLLGIYHSTLLAAGLSIAPDRLALLRAISTRQQLVDGYFATVAGACEIDDFYTMPELAEVLAV